MPCSREKCPERPRWVPVLELRSRRDDSPARVKFRRLGYCDAHRGEVALADLLSDEGAGKLAKLLRESGRPEPDPRLTKLAWERATGSDLTRLARKQDRTPPATAELDAEPLTF